MNSKADMDYMKTMVYSDDRPAILDELMTEYGRDVWNFAYSMVRKREVADDIAQDVFLKAYRHLFTFRSESSVKTWLLAITRNTVLDYRRSAYFRRITLVDYVLEDTRLPSAEEAAIGEETVSELWDMVLSLPSKYKEVIILFAHHQLSVKEIAGVLGVSEGTVKSRLHHARRKLAKLKERHYDGTER